MVINAEKKGRLKQRMIREYIRLLNAINGSDTPAWAPPVDEAMHVRAGFLEAEYRRMFNHGIREDIF